eukprot:TRINITY_DN19577_c0_g1_i1.p1 TRINITY_DN19577_c0_g1~~TRINITY_DN19577_c0_g1_i1.p1  ORF type:complete len:817 (+),score=109.67 TRINITY_DN19577_c0_g1_i1:87-2453(+)
MAVSFLAVGAASGAFLIDPSIEGRLRYDGHGALSAGASSRLLYDYEEPLRAQILDYLYKPKFGASLHQVKVEIGGDSQSTDGTEASHQHSRDDLNCHRGYEWWLLEEARKRNPRVVTHALSWAVPKWIGNDTYYSDDNIDYHISWLRCARDEHPDIGPIDYMGIWNERAWGTTSWTKKLRAAMDVEGFGSTKLILPDLFAFDGQILKDIDADAEFGVALKGGGIGMHYPCNKPHPEVQSQYGLKYWASEDYSTEANWAGAGCWGRILSQNFVRMRMTSTISWSLVWSVYDDWPYFGNGLMYAYWPWSGHYTVNAAIWTSAHHCQFTEPGWSYVAGQGAGSLVSGGSYVALVDPKGRDITVIIEKLHGKCLRCDGQSTQAEVVQIQLAGTLLQHASLSVWATNETHQFVRLEDAPVDAKSGIVSVHVWPDSIVTLSSTSGQQKGVFPKIPDDRAFPLPYADDFEMRKPPQVPKFFADNGGSFELAADPLRSGNQVLKQVVAPPPVRNAWVQDVEPISVLGNKAWGANLRVSVDVLYPMEGPSLGKYRNLASRASGLCLDVKGKAQEEGALVDTWKCVLDYNQQFAFDGGLVRVSDSEGPSSMCLSVGPCLDGASVCQARCDTSSLNQKWTLGDDRSLSVNGLCLESDNGGALTFKQCISGSVAQQWSFGDGYVGVCLRVSGGGGQQKRGNCFSVDRFGGWSITEDGSVLLIGQLDGDMRNFAGVWRSIALESRGTELTAFVGAVQVGGAATSSLSRTGRVAIASGWNWAYFDNFAVGGAFDETSATFVM